MLDTPGVAPAYALPVGHSMFDGISIARCEMSESEVLKVMRDGAGLRDQLSKVVERIIARYLPRYKTRNSFALIIDPETQAETKSIPPLSTLVLCCA